MRQEPLGQFLFAHLRSLGVRHCFGIPGDYILPLYAALERTAGIEAVVATHEPCAAFSADAYGRQTGLGVLLLTYGVGGLNALNGVAGAYAERSPLLVISGGPPRGYVHGGDLFAPLRHHTVRDASDQLEIYRRVTDLALRLESAEQAAEYIREVAARAAAVQLPVYLEIPTDLLTAPVEVPEAPAGATAPTAEEPVTRPDALEHAVTWFADRVAAARRPLLLVGEEISRFRLEGAIRSLVQEAGLPVATTVLGKGALPEDEDGVLGVYAGVMTPDPAVREEVERADLVILLGAQITDVNCGAFTADLRREHLLVAKVGTLGDGRVVSADPVPFAPFVRALARRIAGRKRSGPQLTAAPPDLSGSASLMDRYLATIDRALLPEDVVVADTGDSCYGSLFFRTRRTRGYLAPTFYNSMGFAVPAALGAQLADPTCRPVVLVGDGAFQMTGLELANIVRRRLDPLVVLFNNAGFGMQRIFVDGAFNDHGEWHYTRVMELLGGGRAWRVTDEVELAQALAAARAYREGPALIEAVLPRGVISTGLRVMGQALAREKTGCCPLASADAAGCAHTGRCGYCRAAIWR